MLRKNIRTDDMAHFRYEATQSRKWNEVVWSIDSLDIILGLVGGFTSIIWSLLGFIMAPYEQFRYHVTLIRSLYSTSSGHRKAERLRANTYRAAKEHMESTISEDTDKFSYTFTSYWVTWLVSACFPCCLCQKMGCCMRM